MKLIVLLSTAAGVTARLQVGGRFQLVHSQQFAVATPSTQSDGVHFGDTDCACIGFDNIEGETLMQVALGGEDEERTQIAYPADVGARCEAWDKTVHPDCKKGGKDRPTWCTQPWCYVDPCRCNIDVLPKISTWMPGVTYRGKPLFWSYATCGGKDMFSQKVPQVGSSKCRCIGFAGVAGTTEVTLRDGREVEFPAELGSTCSAWDKNRHPDCKSENPPSWCKANWCYVDPCECDLPGDVVPKISAYLPMTTFTGKNLYYSYETCGSPDTYTEHNHPDACVNQATKTQCSKHFRCAWTGDRCLGSELVNHPLCKEAAEKILGKDKSKSGVEHWRLSLFAGLVAVAFTRM